MLYFSVFSLLVALLGHFTELEGGFITVGYLLNLDREAFTVTFGLNQVFLSRVFL